MNILIVGDVYSKLGRKALETNILRIKEEQTINFIIVNAENITHGKGCNEKHYKYLMELGVNVITLGNHTFDCKGITKVMETSKCLVRPLNYKDPTPGKGYVTINYNGIKITVFQLLGQVFMNDAVDCPFECAQKFLNNLESDIIICDFHAESTSEKIAFVNAFGDRLTCVFGTHTHVQTADAMILPNGCAYITDVGMTGPLEGVIGTDKNIIVDRYVNKSQKCFQPQETGKTQFSGIILKINETKQKVTNIDRVYVIQ